jgi:hypothetical protein
VVFELLDAGLQGAQALVDLANDPRCTIGDSYAPLSSTDAAARLRWSAVEGVAPLPAVPTSAAVGPVVEPRATASLAAFLCHP